MTTLVRQKIEQAIALMNEQDIELWVVQFARETHLHPEPAQELLVGVTVTWNSAFLIARDGSTVALVGSGDAEAVRQAGDYAEVIPYVQALRPELLRVLDRIQPRTIALNFSVDDHTADGITHGMFLLWQQLLEDTPYAGRVVSAAALLERVRARKLPVEVACIQRAIDATETLFDRLEDFLRPGVTERQAYEYITALMHTEGLEPAWDAAHCPHVAIGPHTPVGHVGPTGIAAEPGYLVFMDLGVRIDGYCADLQRTYYLPRPGETQTPAGVQAAFETLFAALEAGAAALRPGVRHWEVDAAARSVLTGAGYEEPRFAFGHHLGRTAHDGGGTLAPHWERYGTTPDRLVEEGNVFALEYAIPCPEPGSGWVSLEEDVLVGEVGITWLSRRQRALRLLPAH